VCSSDLIAQVLQRDVLVVLDDQDARRAGILRSGHL